MSNTSENKRTSPMIHVTGVVVSILFAMSISLWVVCWLSELFNISYPDWRSLPFEFTKVCLFIFITLLAIPIYNVFVKIFK